jgi:lipopolysaccharide export LptBFGC system permease protein LptF
MLFVCARASLFMFFSASLFLQLEPHKFKQVSEKFYACLDNKTNFSRYDLWAKRRRKIIFFFSADDTREREGKLTQAILIFCMK